MCTKLNHDRCYGCCHAKDCFNGGNCDSLTKRCVCNGCMGKLIIFLHFNVVFLSCRSYPLIFDAFPSVLVYNPDFFSQSIYDFEQRYTTVAFIYITITEEHFDARKLKSCRSYTLRSTNNKKAFCRADTTTDKTPKIYRSLKNVLFRQHFPAVFRNVGNKFIFT